MQKLFGFLMVTTAWATAPQISRSFEIQGHRGARATRPENTLAAFQYALESGATALEMDLGVTRDNEVVINHDFGVNTDLCISSRPELRSLSNPLVHDLTLEQIKSYDCGSIRNPSFPQQVLVPGSQIPTLREVLRFLRVNPLLQARLVKINIETKIDEAKPNATVGPETFVNLVAEVIQSQNFDGRRIILQSFDFRTIIYAKQKWPQLQTSALVSKLSLFRNERDQVQDILRTTGADYISPHGRICSETFVNAAHELGRKVLVWTINKQGDWRHFVRLGVDGVISDDPAPIVADMNEHSSNL